MGIGIIGVLLSHLVTVGEFDTSNIIIRILLFFKQLVYTQGFLFLSGFGLYFSLSKNADYFPYLKRRINRLYIPFLVMTIPFFIIQVVTRGESIWCLIGRLTTVSFWIEGNYSGMWYVAISMVLYILFPFYYKAVFKDGRSNEMTLKVAVGGAVLIILLTYLVRGTDYYNMVEIGVAKIPAFFIGPIFAFLLTRNDTKLIKKSCYYMAGVLIIWIILSTIFHDTEGRSIILKFIFIPLSCIGISCLYKFRFLTFLNRLLKWFGKYSLELYVLHLIILKTPELLPFLTQRGLIITGIIVAILLCAPYSFLVDRVIKLGKV